MSGEARGTGAMPWQFDLSGKVALVTGASGGLGGAMALGLAEAGADMALVARREEVLQVAAARIREAGRRALMVPADLSQVSALRTVVDQVVAEYGRIDILVNAAGVQVRKPLLEMAEEDWERVVGIHLKTVFFLSQSVAPLMIKQGKGKIINIASLASTIGIPNISVYTAAKGGVVSLTRSMAVEWARLGINANAIGPGYHRTENNRRQQENPAYNQWVLSRTPVGRWGTPQDVVGTAVFLASEASDFINGELINVDGGWLAS